MHAAARLLDESLKGGAKGRTALCCRGRGSSLWAWCSRARTALRSPLWSTPRATRHQRRGSQCERLRCRRKGAIATRRVNNEA